MLDAVPRGVKAILVVVVIAIAGYALYYEIWWYTKGQSEAWMQKKIDSEWAMTFKYTEPLRTKGRQSVGDYMVEARHVDGNDYADFTARKESDEGKVVEEITAAGVTVLLGSRDCYKVRLTDATFTTYDEEGNPSSTHEDVKEMYLYMLILGPGGPGG